MFSELIDCSASKLVDFVLLAQPTSPEPQQGSSVNGVIDGKFDSGYLVSVKIGGEVLKGVLYHVPQETQTSETSNASVVPPERRRRRSHKSSKDSSSSKKSRKSYSLSFSEDYARVQPVCYEQEEKVTSCNMASSQTKLTGVEMQVMSIIFIFINNPDLPKRCLLSYL